MCQDSSSGPIVSEDELVRLTELFMQFEGAGDPLSIQCREAESDFNSLLQLIYSEKVEPAIPSVTFSQFRSHTRRICRMRIVKEGPEFPCV
jgi:hypothetical protein